MTVKAADRDPEKTCKVEECAAWRKGESVYCRSHIGLEKGPKSDNGAPEGNANAVTHSGHRAPEFLREDIRGTDYEDTYIASFEALCSRHEQIHGEEPDYFIKRRYRRFVLKDIKEDLIDEYLEERTGSGESDNPLVEEHQTLTEAGVWSDDDANRLISLMSDLSREIRLGLKDFGLLRDPDTKQAEATAELGAKVRDVLED